MMPKPGYRDSKLGEIPPEWEFVVLKHLTSLLKDGTHGSHANSILGVPLLSAKDINDGKINLNNNPRIISFDDYDTIHRSYEIKENDILLTVVGTLGRVALVQKCQKFSVQRSVAVIRVNEKINHAYLAHFFNGVLFQKALVARANASAQAGVYLGELAKIPIPVPPLLEQQKIASILSSIDATLERSRAVLEQVEDVRTTLINQLLSRGIPTSHKSFKVTKFGKAPSSWQEATLEDVLVGNPKNGFSPVEDKAADEVLVLGLSCLTESGFQPKHLKNISFPGKNIIEKFLLNDGDVLISRSNTRRLVGLAGIFKSVEKPCIYPDLMMRLTPSSRITNEFLTLWLHYSPVRSYLTSSAHGTSESMVKLNANTVLKTPILVPTIDEQQKITDVVNVFNNRLLHEQSKISQLKRIKQNLMHLLLTGQKRVNV
jgi:type I restriction enzyme, S subunit